ncbi:MAG: CTP synthase [Patescibacteria group bacterium]
MARYIFVGGGVMSGVGKGVAASSIGKILKAKGFSITTVKIDPYLNVDAGTMNPIEHGEVYVTDDGTEADQDLGNYERFLEQDLGSHNSLTTGKVYKAVIDRERNLEYGGKCVEAIPHISDEIIGSIKKAAEIDKADFVLIEIGGTIGEYQNQLFWEAARILNLKEPDGVMFILVTYLPVLKSTGEMKTKPTQQAVKWLNMAGIQPDMILGRSEVPLDEPRKDKISISCNVQPENVISAPDVDSIYDVPINFEKEEIGNKILKKFGLKARKNGMEEWRSFIQRKNNSIEPVKIGIVGKYFKTGNFTLMDSYISVIESIKHACWYYERKPEITWLDAEKYENNEEVLKELNNFDGIIVPGGFGNRGIEGKIKAVGFCRKNKIPYFGLCLGLQMAVIEFARNVCDIKGANSTEFEKEAKHPVIDFVKEQKELIENKNYGGTMRLGAFDCKLKENTISFKAYGAEMISERHRHRYEVNNKYRQVLEEKGMIMAGINPNRDLVEIIELPDHPFFVGTQFHPEFKSRPLHPSPLFREFINAAIQH